MKPFDPPKTEGKFAGTALTVPAQPQNDHRLRPRLSAVALAYSGGGDAPQVVAKGRGLIAQAIIERARQYGVYVHESRELLSLLMRLDLDQRIPPELYRVVAELLAWVYRLDRGVLPTGAATAGEDSE